MKNISILGSTGSIGTQTLEVIRANKDFQVTALAAKSNITLLEQQTREFQPELVCVWDETKAAEFSRAVADLNVEVVTGLDGLISCATVSSAHIVVAAIVGMIGIRPVMEAIKEGKDIAFANKETLVTAGHLIMPMVSRNSVRMLPVDSEHAAIFQCLNGERKSQVSKLILTASGGPFRGMSSEQLAQVTLEDALRHPNWSMGKKITVDSATMVNKGLEVMEAKWLFGVAVEQIDVVIQPQSLIHSMVEFQDGAIMAQLGTPDMKLPIQYALTYPERMYLAGDRVDFATLGQITFEKPDMETFYSLQMAYDAGEAGGSMPTVYNAANEQAVAMFLDGQIGFCDIMKIIQEEMDAHVPIGNPSLDEIRALEQAVRQRILSRY